MDITRYQGVLGIAAILIVVWLLSENRRAISLRTVLGGIVLQWFGLSLPSKCGAGRRHAPIAPDCHR